jgi:hypothetical protein
MVTDVIHVKSSPNAGRTETERVRLDAQLWSHAMLRFEVRSGDLNPLQYGQGRSAGP